VGLSANRLVSRESAVLGSRTCKISCFSFSFIKVWHLLQVVFLSLLYGTEVLHDLIMLESLEVVASSFCWDFESSEFCFRISVWLWDKDVRRDWILFSLSDSWIDRDVC